jgi:hypothetical protein
MRSNITGMDRFLALFILLFVAACSSEKPSAVSDQPPAPTEGAQYTLEIRPANATRNATIYVVPSGFTLQNATIEWLVNGAPAESPVTGQFIASEVNKNDTVQAKATVEGKEIFSNTIQIQNAPPELSNVKLIPRALKPGDTLGVEATANDIDGDEVTISYEWTKNGEPAGNTAHIDGSLKKGDKISVKITPYDREVYGRPIVLQRDVLNAIPVILENRKFDFDGRLYSYQVKATDSDDDTLTYSLKSGPAGMTINSSTGLVKWDVPVQFTGKTSFTVFVSDGHGGEAVQTFPFEIRLEQKR